MIGVVAAIGAALLTAAVPPALAAPVRAEQTAHPSAYQEDLARLDRDIAAAEPGRLVYARYARATLTGDFGDFARADEEVQRAFAESTGAATWHDPTGAPPEELLLFRATLDFHLHRLAAAERALGALDRLAGLSYARQLTADIALQEGRYEEASRAYQALLAEERSWDHLTRVAYFEWKTGHPKRADALYAEAQEDLTVKQMRSFAWVEVQRGLIDFDRGRYRDALAHYRRAERAYSGYWVIEEHIAQVLARLGRSEEAIALYRRVADETGNPEYVAALANLVAAGDPAEAEALYGRADALFAERYALFPEAALGHYLQVLLSRRPIGPDLLPLAERNVALRPNADSKLLLAQVCATLGDTARARELVEEIEATPWRPAGLRELDRNLHARHGR